jgi:hypothetical protein
MTPVEEFLIRLHHALPVAAIVLVATFAVLFFRALNEATKPYDQDHHN